MKTPPGAELFLSRFAEAEWAGLVRPWLLERRGALERALVVAPTRGQTHALKRRCLEEGIALLGVEFLTPGLARKKRGGPAPLGAEFQKLILRSRIEARLAQVGDADPRNLVLRSLASDVDAALADFADLLRAGFGPGAFPRPELREVFGELEGWVRTHGYAVGPEEDAAAALGAGGGPVVADRLLVLAGGSEGWDEFLGLAALVRRCRSATVVLAEPELVGGDAAGEAWVGGWEQLLGVDALPIDAEEPASTCEPVAALWDGTGGSAESAGLLVGRSRAREMERVAEEVARLLEAGSDNVAVIFPRADAAHARLARLLEDRGTPFADMLGACAPAPVDTRLQRALVDFQAGGGRLDELMALWPLLRSQNLAKLSPGDARAACERLYDEVQSRVVPPQLALLEASDDTPRRELGRVARLLMPCWPAELTLADALGRFEAARDRLMLVAPAGWAGLREFAARAAEPLPARAVMEAVKAFLPVKGPAAGPAGHSGFARVTLTTPRRAASVAWSDVVFAEANGGVWPARREPSVWLGDADRQALNAGSRPGLGLATGDEGAALERRILAGIARDTRGRVIFSASVYDEEDPETALEPNGWLERVMWAKGLIGGADSGAKALARLAARGPCGPEAGAAGEGLEGWLAAWDGRREPARRFDAFFLGDPEGRRRPARLTASMIERGIADPARLWFGAVLEVERVDWRPLRRAREKLLGTAVHRVVRDALKGEPQDGGFFPVPPAAEARSRLAGALSALRDRLPPGRYWDSFQRDVSGCAADLLGQVFGLPARPFAAVELALPGGATVPVGAEGSVPVRGRMDLVLSDRAGWAGATVDIVDFKTGGSARLSARSMASRGASLQLGVYLAAARSLGASGSVWMLKPGEPPRELPMEGLEAAVAKLAVLGRHLSTGLYGALTPDRTEHNTIFEWPLACAPIPHATLEGKFEATFGEDGGEDPEEDDSDA